MAALHTPSPSRTCFMGNGRALHATFSRPVLLPPFCSVSMTGSCASKRLLTKADPAAAATEVLMKFLRENFRDEAIGPPADFWRSVAWILYTLLQLHL